MVFIAPPFESDPTLEAVREKIRKIEAEKQPRRYLGASSIGNPCERAIWYGYHMPELRKPMNDIGHLAVNCGHRSEDVMATYLRLVDGIELHTQDEKGDQFGFVDLDGAFRGHIDGLIKGILQAPKTWHVWEHKSANHKKFGEFQNAKRKHGEKEALRQWNVVYYAQAQLYMHYMDLKRHYTTVSLAGVRDFDSCRTEYNRDYAEGLRAKAQRVVDAKQEPSGISTKPDYYLCRFCDYKEECFK